VYCRKVSEHRHGHLGEALEGRLGCSSWLLNSCLLSPDWCGGEKNQRNSSGFSLPRKPRCLDGRLRRLLPHSLCSSSVRAALGEGFTVMQITHHDYGCPLGAFLPYIDRLKPTLLPFSINLQQGTSWSSSSSEGLPSLPVPPGRAVCSRCVAGGL